MTTKNIEIIILGKVQVVGFRYSTKKLVNSLNLKNRTILFHVDDKSSIVNAFISKIKDSPTSYGCLDNIQLTNINEISDKGFIIK